MKIAQAVEAAGEIVPAIGEVIPELAEGDRAHGEIDAAAAHDQHAEQRAGHAAEQRAGQHGKRRRMHEVAQRQPGAVGAKPEIGGVPETQYAGKAEQNVEPHGRQSEHQHLAGERGIAAEQRQPERHADQHRPNDDEHDQVLALGQALPGGSKEGAHENMPSSPNSPRGRMQQHRHQDGVDHRLAGGRIEHGGQRRRHADQQTAA